VKKLLQKIIRIRNSEFTFDDDITLGLILMLVCRTTISAIRPLRYLLLGRNYLFSFFGRGVKLFHTKNIKLGKWVKIDDYVFLSGLGRGHLTIGDNSGIGAFSRVEICQSFNNLGQHITIGKSVGIGPYASLGGAGGLTIGDECIIGPYFSCHPENHNFADTTRSIRFQGVTRKGIIVGNNCWIGAKVSILDGVTIGNNCVIAAGAVVTKSMPANSVIGGVPAKVLKEIV